MLLLSVSNIRKDVEETVNLFVGYRVYFKNG